MYAAYVRSLMWLFVWMAWLLVMSAACGRIGYEPSSRADARMDAGMDGSAAVDAAGDAPTDAGAQDATPDIAVRDAGPCVPTAEECNGRDDDCDDAVDEAGTEPLCLGTNTCTEGACRPPPGFLWEHIVNGPNTDRVLAVAFDDSGNVRVTGSFTGTVDFGGGERTAATSGDIFVLAVAGDGSYQWDRTFASVGIDEGRGIAVDAAGNVLVAGHFRIGLDFGGGVRSLPGATTGLFVLSLDATGDYRWDRAFGSDFELNRGPGVAVDEAGNLYVVGNFNGSEDFGAGRRTSAGVEDIFVLSLGPDGSHRWDHTFGAESIDHGSSVAVATSGTVFVTGGFQGSVDFGGGLRASARSDIFVLALDSDGSYVWDRTMGGIRDDQGFSIAADTSGGALVTGRFGGTVDFGGGPRSSVGTWQGFILALGADGTYRWDRTIERASRSWGQAVATGAAGRVYVTGSVEGIVDFGGGLRAGAGLDDIFVLGLDSDGGYLWDRVFGGTRFDRGQGIAVGPSDEVVLVGEFADTLDFGGGPHTASGFTDGFILSFSP